MGSRSRSRSQSPERVSKRAVRSRTPEERRRSTDRRSPEEKRPTAEKKRSTEDRKVSRSRSRSSSHGRRRDSRSRSRDRRRSRSASPADVGYRIHLADIGIRPDKYTIEKEFTKFGKILETWVAENPPCFAFVVYQEKEDAEDALDEMNGATLFGQRIRVSWAKPRTKGGRRGGGSESRSFSRPSYANDMRCYNCGRFGHLARNCYDRRSFRGSDWYAMAVLWRLIGLWVMARDGIKYFGITWFRMQRWFSNFSLSVCWFWLVAGNGRMKCDKWWPSY